LVPVSWPVTAVLPLFLLPVPNCNVVWKLLPPAWPASELLPLPNCPVNEAFLLAVSLVCRVSAVLALPT